MSAAERPPDEGDEAMPDGRLAMSVEEAGALLGISRSLAYAAARDGRLPTVRFGRRLLVPVQQLEAILKFTALSAPRHASAAHISE